MVLGVPELVIFDCDGVLVDSEGISNEVLAQALSDAGLPTSPSEALLEYKGLLLSDVVARAERRLGAPLPEGFVEDFESDRAAQFRYRLQPVPGAASTVRSIRAAGVGVCVASQGKLQKTELTLSLTGLRELFSETELFSSYSVTRGKPHPDLFLHAAAVMGTRPDRCVVVEDTAIGVTAGRSAGMRVFGYAENDGTPLRDAGAEIVHALPDLPGRIGIS